LKIGVRSEKVGCLIVITRNGKPAAIPPSRLNTSL
jgi:hypothetical protein